MGKINRNVRNTFISKCLTTLTYALEIYVKNKIIKFKWRTYTDTSGFSLNLYSFSLSPAWSHDG